ncbi:TIGR02328 family protein [Virgibacillus sp. JSM 102003]|uniref:TIGR02328 family protein n=1 Tax=Virgibacillus sp. JSM 102003 TaxID=1562108 RepID=UPI0035BF4B6C
MRLWHEELIPFLPGQQLLGQHRECCALRGNGWGKTHSTVNYVFNYSPYMLFLYHLKVIQEMKRRGYNVQPLWEEPTYRGKSAIRYSSLEAMKCTRGQINTGNIYPEHNLEYLNECINNLQQKGIYIKLNEK